MFGLLAACGSDPAAQTPPITGPGAAGTGGPSLAPSVTAGGPSVIPGGPSTGTPNNPPIGTQPTPGGPGSTPTPGTGGDVNAPVASNKVLPCGVQKVMATSCTSCHAAKPVGGAPMALVTYDDFHKPAITQPTMKVYQLVKTRVHDTVRPMPPTGKMLAADVTSLDAWVDGGALAGTTADAMCDLGGIKPGGLIDDRDGSKGKLVPREGETCYEFKTHQSTTMVDDQPFQIGAGEQYEQFYFKAPWPTGSVATSYATIIDNAAVLHHWLLFSTDELQQEGNHFTAPLPTLIGTNPVLLAGWAVGGPNLVAPQDVGFELPATGKTINVQWHFYNSTGMPQKDKSSVQICTVPASTVKNIGGITWLGTEDIGGNVWFGGAGMPPRKESTFTTTCVPGRRGLQAGQSIQIMGFEPHMHRIGKRMVTKVKKMDGTLETIFDEPFSFGNERHYYKDYELKAGEQLVTSCTFMNDTDRGVPFGESSDTEMCYQFAFSYPAHALSNGAPSLLGVPDTCWGPNM